MKTFKLPDLGEGLPDAIIREWYIKAGDEVKTDQPMVAMETAKALVDVPVPFNGVIEKLFGNIGDTIDTGQPLVGFQGEADDDDNTDAGTVVGAIEESGSTLQEAATGVITRQQTSTKAKAIPAVRMLARQLNVDLNSIVITGDHITAEDVKAAANLTPAPSTSTTQLTGELTELSGVRRAMAMAMSQSHREVVPASLMDQADLHAWSGKQDFSVRILRAIQAACEAVPILNNYFDGTKMATQFNEHINIGIAVDSPHGLAVPVIKKVDERDDKSLREDINRYKQQAQDKTIPQADLQGATIIMSNVGSIAGTYSAPVILPPMVAIIAIGRTLPTVVEHNGQFETHAILPISLTFDHRPVTGGDAARFLKAMVEHLQQAAL